MANRETTKDETPHRWFGTLCGAAVELYAATYQSQTTSAGITLTEGYNWTCHGCGEIGQEDQGYQYLHEARKEANAHAGRCRSMPAPEDDDPVLAWGPQHACGPNDPSVGKPVIPWKQRRRS